MSNLTHTCLCLPPPFNINHQVSTSNPPLATIDAMLFVSSASRPLVLISILSHEICQMLGCGCPIFCSCGPVELDLPFGICSPPQLSDNFLLGQTPMAVKHAWKLCTKPFPLPDNPSTWLTVSISIASLTFSILHVDPHSARIYDSFHVLESSTGIKR